MAIAILISTFTQLVADKKYKEALDTLVDMSLSYKSLSKTADELVYAQTAHEILLFGEQILQKEGEEVRADIDYYIGTAAIAR